MARRSMLRSSGALSLASTASCGVAPQTSILPQSRSMFHLGKYQVVLKESSVQPLRFGSSPACTWPRGHDVAINLHKYRLSRLIIYFTSQDSFACILSVPELGCVCTPERHHYFPHETSMDQRLILHGQATCKLRQRMKGPRVHRNENSRTQNPTASSRCAQGVSILPKGEGPRTCAHLQA
jgi:hypothetical protein